MKELEKQKLINEILVIYTNEYDSIPLYPDFQKLKNDFKETFQKYARNEIINADFDVYESFIIGLASGGITGRLNDAIERYTIKNWLSKSFFDWFPIYRFLEPYDFSAYIDLYKTMNVLDKLRKKLLLLINNVESKKIKYIRTNF